MYPEKVNEAWQNYYREHGLSWLAPQVVASIREAFFAGIEVAEQSVQPTGYQTALIPCPHCGVRFVIDSDSIVASG